jgi:hypothetical protein
MADIHQAIRKKFKLQRRSLSNLPHCAGLRFNRRHLAELLGEQHFNRGVEIGVRAAGFSLYLCQCNPQIDLSCIDPWGEIGTKYPIARQEEIYKVAVARLKPYRATIIRKTSQAALPDIADGSLDFVYIDGDHHYDVVCIDIIEWSRKLRRGGIMGVHDCYHGETGVVQAVTGYTTSHFITPWYVTKELAPTAFWVNP